MPEAFVGRLTMDYAGKVAVITGGAAGIGRALCIELAQQGAYVIVVDIEGEKAQKLADRLGEKASARQCDVSDAQAVDKLAGDVWREYGGVDLVFANAGIGLSASILKSTLAEYEATMGVNMRGVWAVSKAFGTHMVEEGRKGHICLTGSEHSLGLQHAGNGIYTASKHAVLGFGDVLRAELEGKVGVSVLCPGLVATDIADSARHYDWVKRSERAKAMGAAIMAKGLDPAIVARETLEAIERGEFLIVTHPTARAAAQRRWQEIETAFATQPPQDGSRDYLDVDRVVAEVMAELKPR